MTGVTRGLCVFSDSGNREEAFHHLLVGLVGGWGRIEGHHGGSHSIGWLLHLPFPGGGGFSVGRIEGG